jgi:hypothetical protein
VTVVSDQELAEQAFEVMASASGQVGQAYRLVENLHPRILGKVDEVSEDAGRRMRPTPGSTGRATPDVRAATVSTMVHPRPSPQSLLDSSSHSVRLAQAQTGRSALALARRREDLTALQQQIRAVSIERSAAAVLIDQAGDLRRALLLDHEHASEILRCLHVAARLIEQHVVDNVLFDPGAENGDELVTTVRTATEAATAMCGAINAAGHALTSPAASLASEEHLLSTARTSSGLCRRFLDAAAAAGDQLLAGVVDEHTPPAAGRAPLRLLRSPRDPRDFRVSAARHLVGAVRLVLAGVAAVVTGITAAHAAAAGRVGLWGACPEATE